MAALLTKMSIHPQRSVIFRTASSTSASRETSIRQQSADPPATWIAADTCSKRPTFLPVKAILAPSLANAIAMAFPIPRPDPVTKATLSFIKLPKRFSFKTPSLQTAIVLVNPHYSTCKAIVSAMTSELYDRNHPVGTPHRLRISTVRS